LEILSEQFSTRTTAKSRKIAILAEFIQSNLEARELKRAIAVKMALEGELYFNITKLLGMHKSYITIWKQNLKPKGHWSSKG
jgi:putative transposase